MAAAPLVSWSTCGDGGTQPPVARMLLQLTGTGLQKVSQRGVRETHTEGPPGYGVAFVGLRLLQGHDPVLLVLVSSERLCRF